MTYGRRVRAAQATLVSMLYLLPSLIGVSVFFLYPHPLPVLLRMLVALALAVLANVRVWGITFFRTAFAVPIGVSIAASSLIFLLLYNPSAGGLNYFLTLLGFPAVQWLIQPRSSRSSRDSARRLRQTISRSSSTSVAHAVRQ